jgi:hypothetical protein
MLEGAKWLRVSLENMLPKQTIMNQQVLEPNQPVISILS